MSLAESVAEDVLDRLERFPPSSLLFALFQFCEALDEPDHPTLRAVITIWFCAIVKRLPDSFTTTRLEYYTARDWNTPYGGPCVPLSDLVDIGDCVLSIHGHFLQDYHRLMDLDLCDTLRAQLRNNNAAAHGLSLYQIRRTRVPDPHELEWKPERLIESFLKDTPFRDFFYTQLPFQIPRKTWTSHGICLAPSGHGKTQLLGSLIRGFLEDDDAPGLFVLDPHGDLYNTLRQRVGGNRLVVLDPDTHPPPLNFFDFGNSTEAQTLQTFSYLMSSLSGGLSDKQGAIVPYLLKLLRKIQEVDGYASIETLRLIVSEKTKGPGHFAKYIHALPKVDQGFFIDQFYTNRMQETKEALGWKLYGALSSETFREMFGAKHNSINFDQLIAERNVVIVKGGFDSLGEDGMRVFLQFLVAQYYAAGMRRLRLSERNRHLNLFICDEASHILTTPIVARMLFDLRKVACGFLGATQVWEQVATDVKAAVLGNTAIKIVGPVQHNDASVLSREMYCDINFIRSMQRDDGDPFAPWAMHVNGMTRAATKVIVPFFALERMPKLSTDGHVAPRPVQNPSKMDDLPHPSYLDTPEGFDDTYERAMRENDEADHFSQEPSSEDDHIRPARE